VRTVAGWYDERDLIDAISPQIDQPRGLGLLGSIGMDAHTGSDPDRERAAIVCPNTKHRVE
jgi:hypothetical protein